MSSVPSTSHHSWVRVAFVVIRAWLINKFSRVVVCFIISVLRAEF
jgi:hypothetical protein